VAAVGLAATAPGDPTGLGEPTTEAKRCGAGVGVDVALGAGRGVGLTLTVVGVALRLTTNQPTAATNDRWMQAA
jgi:hypothetical protein